MLTSRWLCRLETKTTTAAVTPASPTATTLPLDASTTRSGAANDVPSFTTDEPLLSLKLESTFQALNGVTLTLSANAAKPLTLIIGETGSGKSTLLRALAFAGHCLSKAKKFDDETEAALPSAYDYSALKLLWPAKERPSTPADPLSFVLEFPSRVVRVHARLQAEKLFVQVQHVSGQHRDSLPRWLALPLEPFDSLQSALRASQPLLEQTLAFVRQFVVEAELVVGSSSLKFALGRDKPLLPLSLQPLGYVQLMALGAALSQLTSHTPQLTTILLDELTPGLHPHLARQLISQLKQLPHQIVVTTHSAELYAACAEHSPTVNALSWDAKGSVSCNAAEVDGQLLHSVLGSELSTILVSFHTSWLIDKLVRAAGIG